MRFTFGSSGNQTFALNYIFEVFIVDIMIDNHKLSFGR